MLDKRGLSPIIATVLIILITITAIVLISQILIPFVKNNLYESTRCSQYMGYFTFDDSLGFNCFDSGNALLTVRAKTIDSAADVNASDAGAISNNVTGVLFNFISKDKSVSYTLQDLSNVRPVPSTGSLVTPNPGDLITYNVSLDGYYDRVEMHVVVDGRACNDISDSIKNIKIGC